MATRRQREHKQLVYTEQGRRWFNKSAGRLSKLHRSFKRELGLPRNYRLRAIRKSKGY